MTFLGVRFESLFNLITAVFKSVVVILYEIDVCCLCRNMTCYCSEIVHTFTKIYAVCTTYELKEQFTHQISVKRWTIRQIFSRHILAYLVNQRVDLI